MKKYRVAIIGCGGIANSKHMPALALNPQTEMVAFCDIIVERAEAAAKKYGTPDAKVYEDYRELLKDESIDNVHVCTPNRMHSVISVDALDAGKNVLCEKPMAINAEEAKRMIEARDRNGKILTVGFQYRRRVMSEKMKAVIDTGALGDIYFAKANAIRRRMLPAHGVFLDKYEQGGGTLIDNGCHALDLTLWMINNYEPEYVLGSTYDKLAKTSMPGEQGNMMGPWDPEAFEVEDAGFALIKMKNGATVILESTWALNMIYAKNDCCTICGTKAGISMELDPTFKSIRTERLMFNNIVADRPAITEIEVPNDYAPNFRGPNANDKELANFLAAIEGTAELIVKPEQAYVVTRILDAIYKSQEIGGAVYFED